MGINFKDPKIRLVIIFLFTAYILLYLVYQRGKGIALMDKCNALKLSDSFEAFENTFGSPIDIEKGPEEDKITFSVNFFSKEAIAIVWNHKESRATQIHCGQTVRLAPDGLRVK